MENGELGIMIIPIKPSISNNIVTMDTSILKVITPLKNTPIDEKDLNTISIMEATTKLRGTKKLSEYLLYLSSYAKIIEEIMEGIR